MKPSASALMPYEEAVRRVVSHAQAMAWSESETVSTFDAWGRVLAQDVVSSLNIPALDNTSMDGYAVRVADLTQAGGAPLKVAQRIAAGSSGTPLQPGTVARIFTGAPIPTGADAVVMQEDTRPHHEGYVAILEAAEPGENIRCRGEDVQAGAAVLKVSCDGEITPTDFFSPEAVMTVWLMHLPSKNTLAWVCIWAFGMLSVTMLQPFFLEGIFAVDVRSR